MLSWGMWWGVGRLFGVVGRIGYTSVHCYVIFDSSNILRVGVWAEQVLWGESVREHVESIISDVSSYQREHVESIISDMSRSTRYDIRRFG